MFSSWQAGLDNKETKKRHELKREVTPRHLRVDVVQLCGAFRVPAGRMAVGPALRCLRPNKRTDLAGGHPFDRRQVWLWPQADGPSPTSSRRLRVIGER